jgi:hypothetical protein
MTNNDTGLRQALETMQIEPPGAEIAFAAKLARDNGWELPFAEAVAFEYRRFLYLAATADSPFSPSEAVDRAWHLHLTYSRHYWEVLCGRILGRPLHHDPSLGGAAEDERHADQYAATLARYRDTFGSSPPSDIWPDPGECRKRRPSPSALTGLGAAAGASLLLTACTALAANGGGGAGGWILPVAGGIFILIMIVAIVGQARGKKGRNGGDCGGSCGSSGSDTSSDSSGDGGSSCGGGGCGGGGD